MTDRSSAAGVDSPAAGAPDVATRNDAILVHLGRMEQQLDRDAAYELPAARFAVMVHEGPFGELDQTYGALGTYVAERGIATDGPIREHYLVTADDEPDPALYRTEVCWPILDNA